MCELLMTNKKKLYKQMKRINYLSVLVVALLLGLSACNKPKEAAVATEAVEQIHNVKVNTVKLRDVEQVSVFTATVEPEVKNNIAPGAPGRIRKIFVEVGARVSKGQKLAQMDVANLSNSEVQIENLRRVYQRVKGLYEVGGASQQELDNAKVQLDVAEINFKNLSENTFLLSPISGIVTARNYDEGDVYSGQMPLLTVMQINPVKLKINISETYYSKVRIGMPVDVKIDVFEGESFSGKVSLIYPTIDERTRTFTVEIKLANNNSKVRPGMFARTTINFGSLNNVVVPDRAVIKQSGSAMRYVYVYNNGIVNYVPVELGQRLGDEYEILSGLKDGDQVVVAGQTRLADGAKVKVVE